MHHRQLLRVIPNTNLRAFGRRYLVPPTVVALASFVTLGLLVHGEELPVIASIDGLEPLEPSGDDEVGGSRGGVTVGLSPKISIEGGTPQARVAVIEATARFVSNGYELPDLVVRRHDGTHGCAGHRGLFRVVEGMPVIDLCFGEELLALHELAHAWAHFNLDDADRRAFQQSVGALTWSSSDVPHKFRAVEIAADTMAYGLLSAPATPGPSWDRRSERFEALTGGPPPRRTSAAAENPFVRSAAGSTEGVHRTQLPAEPAVPPDRPSVHPAC
jgi:hypothetical protein